MAVTILSDKKVDPVISELVTKIVETSQNREIESGVTVLRDKDWNFYISQWGMEYREMQAIAQELQNHATLEMVAESQGFIDDLVDMMEEDDEEWEE